MFTEPTFLVNHYARSTHILYKSKICSLLLCASVLWGKIGDANVCKLEIITWPYLLIFKEFH